MIIAAFAGTGKTYFCGNTRGAVDFVSMPYKYLLPAGEVTTAESEALKANAELEMNPDYPSNYIRAIAANCADYEYFVIPSDAFILALLDIHGLPYVLVYPETEAKDEYERRYKLRGNSAEFLEIFIGGWNSFMQSLRSDSRGIHIELSRCEYLTDAKARIDAAIQLLRLTIATASSLDDTG
ncbi:MAG: hypothetical protein LBN97_05355 [Oscillospiraceae bacterium]|jgi:hypothetical protein|nr:hypothetical protein [Oscillospiraceae bacterium]